MTLDRQAVQTEYNFVFTDNQWRILLEEVEQKEIDETVSDVIRFTIDNIDYLESEYAWWEQQVAQAQASKK